MNQTPDALQITPVSPTRFLAPSPTEPFITPTPYLDIPALTLDGLKNAEYHVIVNGVEQTIRMTNGAYQQGTDSASPGFLVLSVNDLAVLGDLNGDRVDDAVIILGKWYGGTGINIYVTAVTNWAGIPLHKSSVLIDDRAIMRSIRIDNGYIIADALVHGEDDPGCCPSKQVTRIFRLVG